MAGPWFLLAAGLVVGVSILSSPNPGLLRESARRLWALRWLLLSMFMIYVWMTPGTVLLDVGLPGVPSIEGLREGGRRVAGLVILVLALTVTLAGVPRQRLLAALVWLSTPLGLAGIARERVAVRLALTLEAVPALQSSLAARWRARVRGAAGLEQACDAFASLVGEAAPADGGRGTAPVRIDAVGGPPWRQWSIPAVVVIGALWLPG